MNIMKKISIILCLIFAIGIFSQSCEKEKISKTIEGQTTNNVINKKMSPSHDGSVWVHYKGHVYLIQPGFGCIHMGYYMRTYKTDGFMVWLLGEDCYGMEGNCLPQVDVKPKIQNIDGNNNNDFTFYEIPDEIIRSVNEQYVIPLTKVVDSDWKSQYEFFKSVICNNCKNIPTEMLKDFSQGKLEIKLFKGNYFVVNQGASQYDDCPTYNWKEYE